MKELPVVWIDTETTGLDPSVSEVVEVAAVYRAPFREKIEAWANVIFLDRPFELWDVPAQHIRMVHDILDAYGVDADGVGVFYRRVMPVQLHLAEPEAMQINGYDAAIWQRDAVPFDEMAAALRLWVPRQGSRPWVGGYHVRYDLGLLEALCRRHDASMPPFHRTVEIETLLWEHLKMQPQTKVRFSDVATAMGVTRSREHTALADAVRAMVIGEKLRSAGWAQRRVWSWRLQQNVKKNR
jgi:DNA polymerase III epsilon subunit-like protein